MPLVPLKIRPGVNTQFTGTLLEAGWLASQLVRFRDGLLQKIGGWAIVAQTGFSGICRGLHSWTQIDGLLDLAVGTHLKLWLYQLGSLYDLTPVQNSGTSAGSFYTTTSGSNLVEVAITLHGAATGDFYEALTSVTGGGVTISGEYVVTVVDVNHFTITAGNAATSGTSFGSGVNWQLLLSVGLADTTLLQGFGTGAYGGGPYGETTGSGAAELCRLWFIDNWGEFMLACPQNAGIYQWEPASGTTTRASIIATAPTANAGILVALPQQQAIAFGTNQGVGAQDPMLVAWSDVGDNTEWTASTTNQAGTYRLPRGSRIVGAQGGPLVVLLWTNEGLWLMQYVGLPFVYSFTQVGFGCGLIAPKAAASTPFGVFWMESSGNFYGYNGSVSPIECTVRDQVYGNINTQQPNKIFAGVNAAWNEVFWFYPSLNSTEIDSYVKYNYAEQLWDYGKLARTAWEDSRNFPTPMATFPGTLQSTTSIILEAGSPPWQVPANWNNLDNLVECIGEGGNGFRGNSGGGGGAGAYAATPNIVLTPGAFIPVTIGAGGTATDTSFNSGQIIAKAGASAPNTAGGSGGQASACVGITKFSGGNGGNATPLSGQGAGGGGAAGPNGAGLNGANSTTSPGGGGGADAGFGGEGGSPYQTGSLAESGDEWGAVGSGGGGGGNTGGQAGPAGGGGNFGGGGGGAGGPNPGGPGAPGAIRITYNTGSLLYAHETGTDAAGAPMDSWAQTGEIMIAEGDQISFMERLLPDFATFVGPIAISAFTLDYPNSDTPVQSGPFTVTPGVTPYVIVRARGRGVALKLESNVLGGNFRLGNLRAKITAAGRR